MDEYELLCESCGYSLAGLDERAVCSECGRKVRESLPTARAGSPWQHAPGLWSWARTNWRTVRRPGVLFGEIRVAGRGWGLLAMNLLLAGFLIADPWMGTLIGDLTRGSWAIGGVHDVAVAAGRYVAAGLVVMVVLGVLTWVEYAGIRLVSRSRRWRLTRAGAWQVCAHASVGWVLSGLMPIVILAVGQAAVRVLRYSPSGGIDLNKSVPGTTGVYELMSVGGLVVGYGAGLLVFEYLVHRGVRACRFAARAG